MVFRKMRRIRQQLPEQECLEVLGSVPRGVLAVLGDDDYPYALPIDFVYEDGSIFFHCAKVGHKIDAIARHDKASFCVMDEGYRKEGEWALNIRSVIAFGRVSVVEDEERAIDKCRKLALRFTTPEEAEAEIEKARKAVRVLELKVEHMTGKLVNEA